MLQQQQNRRGVSPVLDKAQVEEDDEEADLDEDGGEAVAVPQPLHRTAVLTLPLEMKAWSIN